MFFTPPPRGNIEEWCIRVRGNIGFKCSVRTERSAPKNCSVLFCSDRTFWNVPFLFPGTFYSIRNRKWANHSNIHHTRCWGLPQIQYFVATNYATNWSQGTVLCHVTFFWKMKKFISSLNFSGSNTSVFIKKVKSFHFLRFFFVYLRWKFYLDIFPQKSYFRMFRYCCCQSLSQFFITFFIVM